MLLHGQQGNPGVPMPAPCFLGIENEVLTPVGLDRSVTVK